MSQHHGHNIRRSDSYKNYAVASSVSILRSNTAIQIITGGPHRFHCYAAQSLRDTKLCQHARIPCPNAKRITFATHVRTKTRQKRVPRVPFKRCLQSKTMHVTRPARVHSKRGRARLPPKLNGRTVIGAGRERRTPFAGYRESTT